MKTDIQILYTDVENKTQKNVQKKPIVIYQIIQLYYVYKMCSQVKSAQIFEILYL